jgi:hypothetical protein
MERPLAPPPLSDGVICSLLRHEPPMQSNSHDHDESGWYRKKRD